MLGLIRIGSAQRKLQIKDSKSSRSLVLEPEHHDRVAVHARKGRHRDEYMRSRMMSLFDVEFAWCAQKSGVPHGRIEICKHKQRTLGGKTWRGDLKFRADGASGWAEL
jgi:hypothetical protein